MDDSLYPRIRTVPVDDSTVTFIELSEYERRPMSDVEIRRLRDALNADAAERARPQSDLDVNAFELAKVEHDAIGDDQ